MQFKATVSQYKQMKRQVMTKIDLLKAQAERLQTNEEKMIRTQKRLFKNGKVEELLVKVLDTNSGEPDLVMVRTVRSQLHAENMHVQRTIDKFLNGAWILIPPNASYSDLKFQVEKMRLVCGLLARNLLVQQQALALCDYANTFYDNISAQRRQKAKTDKRLAKLSSQYLDLSELDVCCPISCDIFDDPVKAEDGVTYDRKAIEEWMIKSNLSPWTGQKISNHLVKDVDMQRKVDAYKFLKKDYLA